MTLPNIRAVGPTLRIAGLLLVLQAVLVAAFVLPAHKPEPHGVPLGAVGAAGLAESLEHERPGAFDVKTYSTEPAAREAIEQREIYGALVAAHGRPRLLVASAASNSVSQLLRTSFQERIPSLSVTDVKPLVEEDPRGSTLNLLFLPLLIACCPAVMLFASLGLRGRKLIGALAGFATLGGLAVVGLVGEAIGALPGSYLSLSAIAGLIILAVTLPTAALHRLLGNAGVALSALLFILIGNPGSGNATAPEMLPGFWRAISQFMPPGAGGTTLRNTAYFDGNATLRPLLVLSIYAAVGALLLLAVEAVRGRRTAERRRGSSLVHTDPVEQRG